MDSKLFCRNEGKLILRAFFARSPDGTTVLVRYYLLAGATAAPSGLYSRLCHAFIVSSFLTYAKFFQDLLDRFSRLFQRLGCNLKIIVHFARWRSETDWNITNKFDSSWLIGNHFCTYYENLMRFGKVITEFYT